MANKSEEKVDSKPPIKSILLPEGQERYGEKQVAFDLPSKEELFAEEDLLPPDHPPVRALWHPTESCHPTPLAWEKERAWIKKEKEETFAAKREEEEDHARFISEYQASWEEFCEEEEEEDDEEGYQADDEEADEREDAKEKQEEEREIIDEEDEDDEEDTDESEDLWIA